MIIVVAFVISSYTYYYNLAQYNYNNINNGLTQALLGGGIINLKRYASTGEMVIEDKTQQTIPGNDKYVKDSKDKFVECFSTNLELLTVSPFHWEYAGNNNYIRNISLVEYRIYNVLFNDDKSIKSITMYSITPAGGTTRYDLPLPVTVETSDGPITIKETSVYAKINFDVKVAGKLDFGENEDTFTNCNLARVIAVKSK